MPSIYSTLRDRFLTDHDILPVAIYGWWFGQCLGWLAPWGWGAEIAHSGWYFLHPIDILSVIGIFVSLTGLVSWYHRRWKFLSYLDVFSGVMALHLAMGLYATAVDPPATSCVVWMGLSLLSSQRSARKAAHQSVERKPGRDGGAILHRLE